MVERVRVRVREQSGGYVHSDGHVVGVVGMRESIVSTMEFEVVSSSLNM